MKRILSYIIVAIIFLSIGVGATLLYSAKDIEYKDTNVQDALNELTDDYLANEADLLWTNPVPTGSFPAQTLNIDLSKYEYVVLDGYYTSTSPGDMGKTIIKVGSEGIVICTIPNAYYNTYRRINTQKSGITFSIGLHYNGQSLTNNSWATPQHIWGIKHLTIN